MDLSYFGIRSAFLSLLGSSAFPLTPTQEVVDLLDVRLMMKVPYNVLKERREERQVYVLQSKLAMFEVHVKLRRARSR